MFQAYAASSQGSALEPFEFQPGPLGPDEVEIDVAYCGLCHSDLAMLDNEFGATQYPFVPGHEVAGTVSAVGEQVKNRRVGDKVGLGWYSHSCLVCQQCMSGDHNLCGGDLAATIIGRHGGFANKVRCQSTWAIPIPDAIETAVAGPLFCGGVTVFNPLVQFDVRPTDRVGVVGIGGLGHLALQFLNKWGCEVVAFSSSESKTEEAQRMGAHSTINSRSSEELAGAAGSFDLILSTVAVDLDWTDYVGLLGPRGRLHSVGIPPQPIAAHVFALLEKQRSISSSPLGSPATTAQMLSFCARHKIEPITEEFPLSRVNDAIERLKSGNARYRVVLKNDLG